MPRSLRIEFPGAFYHVMAHGNGRETILYDDEFRPADNAAQPRAAVIADVGDDGVAPGEGHLGFRLNGTLVANVSTTVSGTGTVAGNATIQGIHNPGNSPGIQTFESNLS